MSSNDKKHAQESLSSRDDKAVATTENKNPTDDTPLVRLVAVLKDDPDVKREVNRFRVGPQSKINPASNPTGRFMQEVGSFELLTAEEEFELFTELSNAIHLYEELGEDIRSASDAELAVLKAGVAARQRIYNANLRLCVNLAKSYQFGSMDLLALINEGATGLQRGIELFDITLGYKFSTYATTWVRQAITRALADKSRAIRLPVHVHEQVLKYTKHQRELSVELGRDPTNEEIAIAVNKKSKQKTTPEKVAKVFKIAQEASVTSLQINTYGKHDGEGQEIGLMVADDEATVESELLEQDRRNDVATLLRNSSLSDKEKMIISLRFGVVLDELVDYEHVTKNRHNIAYSDAITIDSFHTGGMTLEEVGSLLHLTRERIRQIEKKSMLQLKEHAQRTTTKSELGL